MITEPAKIDPQTIARLKDALREAASNKTLEHYMVINRVLTECLRVAPFEVWNDVILDVEFETVFEYRAAQTFLVLLRERCEDKATVRWQPIADCPTNKRVYVYGWHRDHDPEYEEEAMAWKDLSNGRFYYAPQGGVIDWEPTMFMLLHDPPKERSK